MKAKYSVEKVNIDTCLEVFGGSRFQLILAAAARAREIANSRLIADRAEIKPKYEDRVCVQALLDVEAGKVGLEYLKKVK